MLEDQILINLLGKSAESAMDEIKTTGTLSQKNAIPLMLKSQFNHIAHLDEKMEDMVTKNDFNNRMNAMENKFESRFIQMEGRLANLENGFGLLKWFMVSGFSFLGILIAVVPIIYHKIL